MQEQTRPRSILIGAEHCIYVRCGMSSLKCVEHNPDYTLAYKLKILWTLAAICESTCGSQENKLLPSCKISSGLLSYGHSLHGHLVDITAKPSNRMGSALTQCQSWKPKRMLTALTGNDSDLRSHLVLNEVIHSVRMQILSVVPATTLTNPKLSTCQEHLWGNY